MKRVLQVAKYNQEQLQKWNSDVDKWRKEGYQNIIPQIAFYLFYGQRGQRKTGYVCRTDGGAYYFRTKREAVAKFCSSLS